ncbi:MAG: IS1595 family transposase [Lentisphaeraceae bacterium]|nr:IS1595 family transposase [Lentisphaeraceae bacterium]
MAINKIQLQKGMSLIEFLEEFPDEKSCCDFLRQQKWSDGFKCRHCSHHKSSIQQRGTREIHECLNCFYQESLTAHTLFEYTRLPLQKWFLAIQLLTQAKTCMSAMELHRHLNINIKTAQLLKHKLMQTLTEMEGNRVLTDRVECDYAYLRRVLKGGKPGRDSGNKVPFVAAVQTDKSHHPHFAILTPLKAFTRAEIKNWSQKHLAAQACVVSYSLDCFKGVDSVCHHKVYNTKKDGLVLADTELKWVKTLLFNVKTAFSGALHAFNFHKYSRRYLGNMQFRFNHRFDLKGCFYEVLHSAVITSPKPEKILFSALSG